MKGGAPGAWASPAPPRQSLDRVTVLDDVRNLVARLSPKAVCDDCIAERLHLTVRQHANHKTRELAGCGGFERSKGSCSLCGCDKLVIRKT
jgi:hypothetical protein